ncbi:hypothetical protein GEMRC1_010850 [Eukaryota sp. GEM-RC1]
MSLLGFPGTTGSSYMDYLVADSCLIPSHLRQHYTEKILYLPASCYVNDHCQLFSNLIKEVPKNAILPRPEVASIAKPLPFSNTLTKHTRQDFGLPPNKILLCNFNQLYKLDPYTFDVWCRVLYQCPETILVLLRFPRCAESMLRKRAAKNGVAGDRVLFVDVKPQAEHIQRTSLCDLFLDTVVINAHHTGMDALWAGVPVISIQGEKLSARVGSSLLTAMGLEELVCSDLEEYEAKAVHFASNIYVLREQQNKVRLRRFTTSLFDTLNWTRNFEKGLEVIVEDFNRGEQKRDVFL